MGRKRKASGESRDATPTINGLGYSPDGEINVTREPSQDFLKGEARKRQRRVDLRTLHGTARESARIYRAMVNGEISQEFADTASRVLGRHRDILAAHDQSEYHRSIEERLMVIEQQRKPALPSVRVPQQAINSEKTNK